MALEIFAVELRGWAVGRRDETADIKLRPILPQVVIKAKRLARFLHYVMANLQVEARFSASLIISPGAHGVSLLYCRVLREPRPPMVLSSYAACF